MSSAAVTVLDMVNKILVRLRESGVSSIDSTDQSSTILRLINDAKREVEDAFNWTSLQETITIPYDYARQQSQTTNNETAEPVQYAVAGVNATQSLNIRFYQTPDAVYSMDVECVIPQEDLNGDTQYTKVPWNPVYLKALALAIRERGEDEGEQSSDIQRAYQQAIGDAIAYEQTHKWQSQGGGDWTVLGDY